MNIHKKHNVLGDYCWDCQQRTKAGIPGWSKPSRDDGPQDINVTPSVVVWADGSEDFNRICDNCGSPACKTPVHKDHYQEV